MLLESLCAVGLIARLVSACAPPPPAAVGYVEGEYVALAPLDTAHLVEVPVRLGQRVAAGEVLARAETADAELALRDATAKLAQAESDLANLQRGRRPEEIAVVEATLAAAQAQSRDAQRTLERRRDLAGRGVASQADLDLAQTALDVARAKVGELSANLAVAKLPARPEEIASAGQRVEQARAALATARWRLDQRTVKAPAPGRVADVIRRAGEIAGPAAPALSLLPDGAVKLKLYLAEPALAGVAIGKTLAVRCDGCAPGLSASVTYVSPDPEFTPPVIYSLETRQKLVYLVEARPDPASLAKLQPGLIVDVSLADAPK
jgi:HlyD family secretion protein